MKNLLFFSVLNGVLLAGVVSMRASEPRSVPFHFDNKRQAIAFVVDNRPYDFTSDYFRQIIDWSVDYSRNDHGDLYLLDNDLCVFPGWLSLGRRVLFIYDRRNGRLETWDNISEFALDSKFGWAFVRYAPKYSDAAREHKCELIVNGGVIGELDDRCIKKIGWKKSAPVIELEINTEIELARDSPFGVEQIR